MKHLQDMTHLTWTSADDVDLRRCCIYTHLDDGEQYDFIVDPKPETGKLIVFFSGDAKRKSFEPPVFQRWSWASKFPATCVYVSDPALYHLENLGLAWYAGYQGGDYLQHIWSVVDSLLPRFGVTPGSVYSYGSSGGGYAALRSARYSADLQVVAINPQTDLWRYPLKFTSRLARASYGVKNLRDVEPEEHYKFSALDPQVVARAKRIFLAQNQHDTEHYENHYSPFIEFANTTPHAHKLVTKVFMDESGHAGGENKETFQEILEFMGASKPGAHP